MTVLLGSAGLALHGSPFGSWIRNPAAWVAGLAMGGIVIATRRPRAVSFAAIGLAIVALVATLFAPAQSGVHRWVDLGPLHINMATLLLPAAIVALATASLAAPHLLLGIAAIAALLAAQPDASQASAFAAAAAILLHYRADLSPAIYRGALTALAALTAVAWARPDNLQPIAEVEGVLRLIADVSLPLASAAGAALLATSLSPLWSLRGPGDARSGPAALAAYFIVSAIMPFFGAYPVPLIGIGMSFPVGYWLGMSLLHADGRRVS